MTLAVEAQDLFRVHSTPEGDAAALQGLTLSVAEGEILTVLGPSGAGKTSFLRILAGLDLPSAGTIRVLGQNLRSLGRGGRARYRREVVGYLDQHYEQALAPELTARELVGLRLRAEGRDWAPRAEELLRRVGLGEKLGSRPAQLSGGEQQRVALCAALAHRPRLLLADEPTGELDEASASLVYEAIAELAAAENCTVVIVSHDPASTAIADRFVHIRDGRVSEETVAGEGTIVVGRGGWLRLPQEFLERAGIGTRAAASLEDGRIVVSAAGGDGVRPEPELAPLEPVPAGGAGGRAARSRQDARPWSGRRPRLRRPRRRVRRRPPNGRHRPLRLGQDDAAAPARRARPARRGRGARRRRGRERARPQRSRRAAPPRGRARAAAERPRPVPERARERRARAGDPGARGRSARGARLGRACRARGPAGLAALGRRAGSRRGGAGAGGAAGAAARRRADGAGSTRRTRAASRPC